MDTSKIIQILEALAGGIDPLTGEMLPADHCLQQAEVLRALFAAINLLKNNDTAKESPAKQGVKWTVEEDLQLKDEFAENIPVSHLAKIHQRSYGAIRSRLIKFGLIKPEPDDPQP